MKSDARDKIFDSLSDTRMRPYLDASHQNKRDAIQLYLWHCELSAAVQTVLSITEVALRNAIDAQLLIWLAEQPGSKPSWLLDDPPTLLRQLVQGKRREALSRAEKEKKSRGQEHPRHHDPVTHDDVLAQVTFGMWKEILPNHLPAAEPTKTENISRMTLWSQALGKAFPSVNDSDGSVTFWRVAKTHRLRNRVSHMEPLLTTDVAKEIENSFSLVRSIDPVVANWLTGSSKVSAILRLDPRL